MQLMPQTGFGVNATLLDTAACAPVKPDGFTFALENRRAQYLDGHREWPTGRFRAEGNRNDLSPCDGHRQGLGERRGHERYPGERDEVGLDPEVDKPELARPNDYLEPSYRCPPRGRDIARRCLTSRAEAHTR
jgi:hypothetical protein